MKNNYFPVQIITLGVLSGFVSHIIYEQSDLRIMMVGTGFGVCLFLYLYNRTKKFAFSSVFFVLSPISFLAAYISVYLTVAGFIAYAPILFRDTFAQLILFSLALLISSFIGSLIYVIGSFLFKKYISVKNVFTKSLYLPFIPILLLPFFGFDSIESFTANTESLYYLVLMSYWQTHMLFIVDSSLTYKVANIE